MYKATFIKYLWGDKFGYKKRGYILRRSQTGCWIGAGRDTPCDSGSERGGQ